MPLSEYDRGNKNAAPTGPIKEQVSNVFQMVTSLIQILQTFLYQATEESAGFSALEGRPSL